MSYQGSFARLDAPSSGAISSLSHLVPQLAITAYGGDWFLHLELGSILASALDSAGLPLARPAGSGPAVAHDFANALGSLEAGVHLPGESGLLAVGLRLAIPRIGINDAARSGPWLAGGSSGFDCGIGVHYVFALFDRVRVDPSVFGGAGILDASIGAWGGAELETFTKISELLSVHVAIGGELRRYQDKNDATRTLDARALRFELGLAFHGLFGFGENRFD